MRALAHTCVEVRRHLVAVRSVLSFYRVGFGNMNPILRLSGKSFCLLSYLESPNCDLILGLRKSQEGKEKESLGLQGGGEGEGRHLRGSVA